MNKLKSALYTIADFLTAGSWSHDQHGFETAKTRCSPLPDAPKALMNLNDHGPTSLFDVRIENGRRIITFKDDVVFEFEGNVGLLGKKFVMIESGWKNSNDHYKLHLNPENTFDQVTAGTANEPFINSEPNCCGGSCKTSSEKVTCAPDTDASAQDQTTRVLPT